LTAALVVEALSPARLAAWAALFDASASPCFCRYWHFASDKNAWLARCAFEPEKNRAEQVESFERGDEGARGLVAMRGDACVGWMKLVPRSALPKLVRLGPYKSSLEASPSDGVYAIGCLLVAPGERRRGVADALILAAAEHARSWGARAIEAFPHVQEGRAADEQMWRGALGSYTRAGFVKVAGELPYPILRIDL